MAGYFEGKIPDMTAKKMNSTDYTVIFSLTELYGEV